MVRSTIDKHFTDNIGYYKKVCRSYFKNHLADDLLQETYLAFIKIDESVIKRRYPAYNETAYLKYVGKKIIKSLVQKSGNIKKNKNGSTSPLFDHRETINVEQFNLDHSDDSVIPIEFILEDDQEIQERKKQIEKYQEWRQLAVSKITDQIFEGIEAEDYNTEVFVMAQIESIRSISMRTKTDRNYVTKAYKQKCDEFKKLIA